MIVEQAEFLIEEDADGYHDWDGGSDDRATVYDNIIEEHKENK